MMKTPSLKTTYLTLNPSTTFTSHLLQNSQATPVTKATFDYIPVVVFAMICNDMYFRKVGVPDAVYGVKDAAFCFVAAKGYSQASIAAPSLVASVAAFTRR